MSNKSVFGLSENTAGALSYAVPFVSGIALLVMEKENKFVRFHSLQAVVTFGALFILDFAANLLRWLPIIGGLLQLAVGCVFLASWIYLMYTAYKGVTFKVPIIGDAVWEQINK